MESSGSRSGDGLLFDPLEVELVTGSWGSHQVVELRVVVDHGDSLEHAVESLVSGCHQQLDLSVLSDHLVASHVGGDHVGGNDLDISNQVIEE